MKIKLERLADRVSGSNGFMSPDERQAIAAELRTLANAPAPAAHGGEVVIDAELDDLILRYGNERAHGLMDEAATTYTEISCRIRPHAPVQEARAEGVPKGWKLVPMKAAKQMLLAFKEGLDAKARELNAPQPAADRMGLDDFLQAIHAAGYCAMLAASPEPPTAAESNTEQGATPDGAAAAGRRPTQSEETEHRTPNGTQGTDPAAFSAKPAAQEGDDEAARRYIRDWCPDHVKDYIDRLAQPVGEVDEALFQNTAAEYGEAQDDGGWYFDADAFDAFCTALTAARLPKPAAGVVPGVMHCAKCKFRLVRTNFHVANGALSAGDNKTEPCPNGCGPLWPVTWEQEARECWERLEEVAARPPAGTSAVPLEVREALQFLCGLRVFVTSRERIKKPEGDDLFDKSVATIERWLRTAALTPAGGSGEVGS